jgi:hypothetical protein
MKVLLGEIASGKRVPKASSECDLISGMGLTSVILISCVRLVLRCHIL